MPPVQSVPSDEVDDDVAFKVLNQDNLPVSIVGESILKPFQRDGSTQKPNMVVYPTRRITNNLEENKHRPFTKSHGHINNRESDLSLQRNYSISQGNLNHNNYLSRNPNDDSKHTLYDDRFTKTLDAKLKKLQREEKLQSSNKKTDFNGKKPFMTVVKKGQFLEPPPEIATLLGLPVKIEDATKKEEKRLYAFESRPRVLNRIGRQGHKARCEAAARAAASIVGGIIGIQDSDAKKDFNSNVNKKFADAPMPYANLMFDRRVIRGSNYAQHPMQTGDGESAAARAAEARRRALARRKAQQKQQITRGAHLRLGSPPPVAGRKHERIQTEKFLEEIFNDPPVQDMCTQTDLFLERPVSPFYVPAKTGADVETQIYPGDLFDFDMEVQPILEVLVGKTIEQALIEVLEEEELAALREQQRRFLEIRAAELAESQRLAERELRLKKEKEERFHEYEQGLQVQQEMEERIAAAVLMQGYMADLLPSVLEGLEEEGFLTDNIKQDIDETFMPWLMKEVTHELKEIVSSRDVLAEMVKDIIETRAELYRALHRSPRAESEEEEEEGEEEGGKEAMVNQEDLSLSEHLKLKESFLAGEQVVTDEAN